MFTAHIDPDVLAAHGRLRLLRQLRNQEAQKLRGTIERMHGALLKELRSLDMNDLTPVNNAEFRHEYRALRTSEVRIAEIDSERHEVQALLP